MKRFLALLIIICVLLTGCSFQMNSRDDIACYEEDLMIGNASLFMPDLADLGSYTDIKYTYQETFHVNFIYCPSALALFVKYDENEYRAQKDQVLNSYHFLEKPIIEEGQYILPLTEFSYKGYSMKVVPDEDYLNIAACKSFMMLGFNDDTCAIAYLYYYDTDIDFIAQEGEDARDLMLGFIDDNFLWKAF